MNMISEKSKKEISPFEKQAQFFKLLTHPARLAILEILRDGEHCVCHMEAYLGYKQAYISQQLSVLREAGLIQDRRDGWNIFYRVADTNIFEVLDALSMIDGQTHPNLDKIKVICNCPHCSKQEITK
jgi:DNA-binding transcriptional ArsR family regulator